LEGYNFGDLKAIASNPFNPPAPGMDDPHYGVDFPSTVIKTASGFGIARAGSHPWYCRHGSADRFPYGIGVIIETPLDQSRRTGS
jgi:hypothetical protein